MRPMYLAEMLSPIKLMLISTCPTTFRMQTSVRLQLRDRAVYSTNLQPRRKRAFHAKYVDPWSTLLRSMRFIYFIRRPRLGSSGSCGSDVQLHTNTCLGWRRPYMVPRRTTSKACRYCRTRNGRHLFIRTPMSKSRCSRRAGCACRTVGISYWHKSTWAYPG